MIESLSKLIPAIVFPQNLTESTSKYKFSLLMQSQPLKLRNFPFYIFNKLRILIDIKEEAITKQIFYCGI